MITDIMFEGMKKRFLTLNCFLGGFWDFTADLSSKDTAYTQEALPLHTDTTYFSDPAGLQLFHLLSHTDGEGGETVLVDGFRAAHNMKYQDNSAYKILKNTSIYAHASGNIDSSIQPCKAYPVINEDQARRVMQIRWNPADRAGIGMAISEISEWYQAAKYVYFFRFLPSICPVLIHESIVLF